MQIHLPLTQERDAELGEARVMTQENFESVFESIRQHALVAIAEQGAMTPLIFLPSLFEGGLVRMGIMPVGELINHPVGKDLLAEIMNRLIEDPNHDFVVFAHEAWMLMARGDDPGEAQRLREAASESIENHPERSEAVVITMRSRERQAMAIMPITRTADSSIVHVDPGHLIFPETEGHRIEGRFSAPTRPPGVTLH